MDITARSKSAYFPIKLCDRDARFPVLDDIIRARFNACLAGSRHAAATLDQIDTSKRGLISTISAIPPLRAGRGFRAMPP